MSENPLSNGTTPRYSYNWALGVVQTWCKDHARVLEDLYKIPWISPKHLAKVLVDRPNEWRRLKQAIKKAEKLDPLVQKGLLTTTQALSSALKYNAKATGCAFLGYLTAQMPSTMLGEPFERGASPRSASEGAKASSHSWIQGDLFGYP